MVKVVLDTENVDRRPRARYRLEGSAILDSIAQIQTVLSLHRPIRYPHLAPGQYGEGLPCRPVLRRRLVRKRRERTQNWAARRLRGRTPS